MKTVLEWALALFLLAIGMAILGGVMREGRRAFRSWRHVDRHRRVIKARERMIAEGRKA